MKKWDEMEGYEKIELADDIEQILSQDDIVDIWNEYYKDDEVMQSKKLMMASMMAILLKDTMVVITLKE